ncbi:unnamed protein product [Gordionus sp. m RMFG-2023]
MFATIKATSMSTGMGRDEENKKQQRGWHLLILAFILLCGGISLSVIGGREEKIAMSIGGYCIMVLSGISAVTGCVIACG